MLRRPIVRYRSNPDGSISKGLSSQENELLRKGIRAGAAFNQIRQRHLWSTYHFGATAGGALSQSLTATVLAANDYPVFTTPSQQNGQGLPSGTVMTDLDTNFAGAGRVTDMQNFAIWELGFSVLPPRQDVVALNTGFMSNVGPSANDLDAILSNALLSVKYLTNEVILGPAGHFLQSGGCATTYPSLLDSAGRVATEAGPPALQIGGLQQGSNASPPVTPWTAGQSRNGANAGPMPPSPALRRQLQVPIFLKAGDQFSCVIKFPRPVTLNSVRQGGAGGFRCRIDWWVVESFNEQG